MSERLGPLLAYLNQKVNEIRVRLIDLGSMFEGDRASGASIDRQIGTARKALRKGKDDAAAARVRMEHQLKAKKGEQEDLVAEWTRSRNVDELEHRAVDAEVYAAWSLMCATSAFDEAHLATLRAIAARQDVEAVES